MADGLRPPYDTNRGTTCSCMLSALPLLEYRLAEAGVIKQDLSGLVYQWSGRSNVPASKSTHKSGAVFDVDFSLISSDAELRIWLECGFIAFRRFSPPFDDEHGHVCVAGCPHLDPSAQAQINQYRYQKDDGLVSDGPYPGPHDVPFRTWQRAMVVYAGIVRELNMDPGDVWAHDLDDDGHDARWYATSTRESALIIGRRTQAIVDQQTELGAAVAGLLTVQRATAAAVAKLTAAQAELRADVADLATALAQRTPDQ